MNSRRSRAADDRPRPPQWKLSPVGGAHLPARRHADDGTVITPKYIGSEIVIEQAIVTLATDRALLLLGVPGTAKTWVSEHLAAAISGVSTRIVQGTAGTTEEAIRYGWNYAQAARRGPEPGRARREPGDERHARRRRSSAWRSSRACPSEVQDALITILSEKTLAVPELDIEVQGRKGFNVIATANNRDKGVNDLSSALRRRFNTVVLPLPATPEDEVRDRQPRASPASARRSSSPPRRPRSTRSAAS